MDDRARDQALRRGALAAVALAVGACPNVLLLDHPAAGLDPLVRRECPESEVRGEGGAVVCASLLIHDLERVADRIVYFDAGRIRAAAAPLRPPDAAARRALRAGR